MSLRWFAVIWAFVILMGILSVIYGCAIDPNHESMDECQHYKVYGEFEVCE